MATATTTATATATATCLSISAALVHSALMLWEVPIEMTDREEKLCRMLGVRSRFYCFLRRTRHLVFDAAFQQRLASMYEQRPSGKTPVPPAMLAMTVLLQAYTGASDAEAIECLKADQRWQVVIGCLDAEQKPFCQKTLAFFRQRLVETEMDKELLARTVQLARDSKLFDPKKIGKLKVAIDSAPLQGAGRVEDTINLIGRAIRNLVKAIVDDGQYTERQLVRGARLTVVGPASVKARLDIDWSDQRAQTQALRKVVQEAERLQKWINERADELDGREEIEAAIETLRRVVDQDIEPDPDGSGPRIKQGVARDRQISLSDPDMRHGRKSSARRIDGYKRYQAADLQSGLALGACVLPANVAEQEGADKLRGEIQEHGVIEELHADRAFLGSNLTLEVWERRAKVIAKPHTTPNRGLAFTKQQFDINLKTGIVRCPGGKIARIRALAAKFSGEDCARCALRSKCQECTTRAGRIVTIHPHEDLMQELQMQLRIASGRRKLRRRVMIEHNLAHHCGLQGPRARYRGTRKNDFDARRIATVNNLMLIAARSDNGEALERMAA